MIGPITSKRSMVGGVSREALGLMGPTISEGIRSGRQGQKGPTVIHN